MRPRERTVELDGENYTVRFHANWQGSRPASDQACTTCSKTNVWLSGMQVMRVVSITRKNPDTPIMVDGQVGRAVAKKLQADLWTETNVCDDCGPGKMTEDCEAECGPAPGEGLGY